MQVHLNPGIKYCNSFVDSNTTFSFIVEQHRFLDAGDKTSLRGFLEVQNAVVDMLKFYPNDAWGGNSEEVTTALAELVYYVTWTDLANIWFDLPLDWRPVFAKMILGNLLSGNTDGMQKLFEIGDCFKQRLDEVFNSVDAPKEVVLRILLSQTEERQWGRFEEPKARISMETITYKGKSFGFLVVGENDIHITLKDDLAKLQTTSLTSEFSLRKINTLAMGFLNETKTDLKDKAYVMVYKTKDNELNIKTVGGNILILVNTYSERCLGFVKL